MTATCYTGSWFDRIPPGHVKIGVSRGTPRGMTGIHNIRDLNPGAYFRTASTEEYRAKYAAQLAALDPEDIVRRIDHAADGRIAVLCCYERITDRGAWCHRGYVSAWLCMHLGLVVPELTDPSGAFAGSHAMIPAEYRIKHSTHTDKIRSVDCTQVQVRTT